MEPADFTQSQDWRDFQEWQSNRQNMQHSPMSANTQTPERNVQRSQRSPTTSLPEPRINHSQRSASTLDPEATNNPEAEESSAFSQMTIDDLLLTSGRENMTELNPKRCGKSTWFKYDNQITKAVLQMLKSDLPVFSATYRDLPPNIKSRWFKAFAQEYNWNPTYSKIVRKSFDFVATKLYSNHVYRWKKDWKNEKGKPIFITNVAVWNGFVNHWQDEKAKKIAAKNKGNRDSYRGGDGPAAHTTGAKSFDRRFDEMTQEAGGVEPNMVDFMVETHKSKKTNLFVDRKAERIVKNCWEREENMLSQETQDGLVPISLSQSQKNEIFFQEVEPVKGSRFGISTLSRFSKTTCTFSEESTSAIQEELQTAKNKITEMEKNQEKQAMELEYFKSVLFKQFPHLADPTLD